MPTPEELARPNIDALMLIPKRWDQQFAMSEDSRKFTVLYKGLTDAARDALKQSGEVGSAKISMAIHAIASPSRL